MDIDFQHAPKDEIAPARPCSGEAQGSVAPTAAPPPGGGRVLGGASLTTDQDFKKRRVVIEYGIAESHSWTPPTRTRIAFRVAYTSLELLDASQQDARTAPGSPATARFSRKAKRPTFPPQPSKCTKCHGIFNTNPWAAARTKVCQRCGAERWAESPSHRDFPVRTADRGGRPAAGITDEQQIRASFEEVMDEYAVAFMQDPDGFKPPGGFAYPRGFGDRNNLDAYVVYRLVTDKRANPDAIAPLHAKSRPTVRRWLKRETDVRQNSTDNEGRGMNAASVNERLERLERRLDEMARDTADTAERIRERFPKNDEVARAVEDFLGEALSEAA